MKKCSACVILWRINRENEVFEMKTKTIEQISAFEHHLMEEEKSKGTIGKYIRDVSSFLNWLNCREIDKNNTVAWKEHLLSAGYSAVTINSKISSLNSYLRFQNRDDCQVKFLKIQRQMFRPESKELNINEYFKLVQLPVRTIAPRFFLRRSVPREYASVR